MTGWRGGRNKGGIETLHKGRPAASRSQSLAGSHRARARGKGAGPPGAGRRERGRSRRSASSRCGARRVPSPCWPGKPVGSGPSPAARCGSGEEASPGRKLPVCRDVRPGCPSGVSPSRLRGASPARRALPGARPAAGAAPERPGLGAETSRGLPARVPPPAFSSRAPPGNVLGFGVVTGLKNLQADHVSGLNYMYNRYIFYKDIFFCLSSILMLRVTSISCGFNFFL